MKILRCKVEKDEKEIDTKLDYEILAGNSTSEVISRLESKLGIKTEDFFFSASTLESGEQVIILKGQVNFLLKNYISRLDFSGNDKIKIFCYIKDLIRSKVTTF